MKWYQSMGGILIGAAMLAVCGCGSGSKGVEQTNKSLTLCIDDMTNDIYEDAFEEYKNTYPDVEFNVEVFSDLMAGMAQVNTQLMAGEGPDLLLMTSYGTSDVYKMMKAQAFAPLDEFMEEDTEWNAEDYIQTVLDAGKYEGKQVVMPLSYRVQMAVTSQENLDSAGISWDSCSDMLTFLQESSKFYGSGMDRVLGDVGQFMTFPEYLSGQFLDYGKGTLGVDEKTLEQACNAYKYYYEEDANSRDYSLPDNAYWGIGEMIADGETGMVVPTGAGYLMSTTQALAANATPVLWPLKNGDGEVCAKIVDYAGIRANSENCQNAWNLLKILMSETGQSEIVDIGNYSPVLRSVLEESIDHTAEQSLERGRSVTEVVELPAELMEQYKDAVMEPDSAVFITDICVSKFLEHMKPFYEDEGSYEDCIAEFQKFIKIYLTE